jgi:hypothetical protein
MDSEDFEHLAKRPKTFHHGNLLPPQHNDYTIAWVCALYFKMAAAQAMLDEIHKTSPRHADDTNTYILGNIKRHNIIIVGLPNS